MVTSGDEYEQVRNEVLQGLRELRHPQDGTPLLTMASRREELFEGRHLDDAPDIVYTLEDGACTVDLRLEGPLFERASWRTGTGMHRFGGVLLACGPHIEKGKALSEVEIVDVAPTILGLLGVPIPAHMDGRVPDGLLTAEARAAALQMATGAGPSAGADEPEPDVSDESAYSEEEARQVEERLKGLGYL
jgi:predicted AlkP superfamily phosphohydrolase/phosphomutase